MEPSTHELFKNTGVIILAGGKSSRMNYPKPYLEINTKETLLEKVHRSYSAFTPKIEVVLNAEFGSGQWKDLYKRHSEKMRIQLNPYPEYGRFFSIQLGLARMPGKAFCLVQNIDNPVSPETILALVKNKTPYGYTVPVVDGKSGHPVLIARTIMNSILSMNPGGYILSDFLKSYPRTEVSVPEKKILLNLNTDSDFKSYLSTV